MKQSTQALLIIDLQPDFLPGGALAVPGGDEIIPTVSALAAGFEIVVATQDWHPPDHGSFAANHSGRNPGEVIELHGLQQVLWPTHCVAGTPGATLVPSVRALTLAEVFRKGSDPTVDSYSGFFDNGKRRATGLADWLAERGITDLVVCGLALDYCVKFTILDALAIGLGVTLVRDATRAVDLQPGDGERALRAIEAAGAKVVDSSRVFEEAV